MSAFNIVDVSEQILERLKASGIKHIHDYRSVSFGMAMRYFSRNNVPLDTITPGMPDAFLYEFRGMYEAGQYCYGTWAKVNRGVGLIQHFITTGEILDKQLPPWRYIHCSFRTVPPLEKLADNDNIRGLIWRHAKN